jgi:predicted DNA-binding transcriptional regulator YafY
MMPQMEPLERLLNLVGLLLETRRPLTFDEIREAMPEAYGGENIESAKRKFERDKDDLRAYDIPLEIHDIDAWGTEQGYVIPKEAYYLPEISFTAEEMAALYVAAQTEDEDRTAAKAVRKLLYGSEGGVLAGLAGSPLAAGSDTPNRRLLAAAEAALRQRRVSFGYRTSAGRASERDVDAYAMVSRGGRWYLVGHDRERDDVRAFRLSRMTTEIDDRGEGSSPPEDFRAAEHVQAPAGDGDPTQVARILFAPDVAWWATTGLPGAHRRTPTTDGRVEVSVPLGDEAAVADWVLGFGPDAEAVSPLALRDEVVRRLREAAR